MLVEPGIYHDLPFEDYASLPYVNSTAIKAGISCESLKKMRFKIESDCGDSDSKAKKFGRAQHAYVLEGEEAFYSRFLVSTSCVAIKKGDGMPCSKAGKFFDGQSWYCGTHAPDGAEEPADYVSPDDLDSVREVRKSLAENQCVVHLKSKGWNEVTLVWDMLGVRCKARLDRFSEKPPIIIDLKKFDSDNLTVRNCNREIASRWYHVQAAFYRMGIEKLLGVKPAFMWIFTESVGPWDVLPMQATAKAMLHGESWVRFMLNEYRNATETGRFPGVWTLNRPAQTELPDWIYTINPLEEPSDDGDNETGAEAGIDGDISEELSSGDRYVY